MATLVRDVCALADSEPDSSPETSLPSLRKLRSSSSLNTLRMSLRKRLPLKTVQSNTRVAENPTWEYLEINRKTSAVTQMKRTAKNSIGSIYQKFQRTLGSQEERLVRTPGRIAEEEGNVYTPTCTQKRPNSCPTVTPRRKPRSAMKYTPQGAPTIGPSGSTVRAVRTGGSRRLLVRMAALRSPFASPSRRLFDQDLDCVTKGLRRLECISQAFDDVISRDDRFGAHPHPLNDYQTATVKVKSLRLCSAEETKSPTSWMPWGEQTMEQYNGTIP